MPGGLLVETGICEDGFSDTFCAHRERGALNGQGPAILSYLYKHHPRDHIIKLRHKFSAIHHAGHHRVPLTIDETVRIRLDPKLPLWDFRKLAGTVQFVYRLIQPVFKKVKTQNKAFSTYPD